MVADSRPHLVQYWHSARPPAEIADLNASFRAQNPGMRYSLYDESSAEDFIAQHLSPREVAAFRSCAVPAMQADYFRYCALYVHGGVFCDADLRCIAPLNPLLDADGELIEGANAAGLVTNGTFGFRTPAHPLLRLTIDVATMGIEAKRCERVAMVTGPAIFTGLATIWRFGFGTYLEWMTSWGESIPQLDRIRWRQQLEATRQLLGDYDTVARAFDGVRISPYAKISTMIAMPPPLSYKEGLNHYPNWVGSIYR